MVSAAVRFPMYAEREPEMASGCVFPVVKTRLESVTGEKEIWCRLGPMSMLPEMRLAAPVSSPEPTITSLKREANLVVELTRSRLVLTAAPMVLPAFSTLLSEPVVASPALAMMLELVLEPLETPLPR